ncbi:WhiB family transcriptional regulator [Nonomuraea bangladeshensis]|uniref:WhiB family transcriptional regulator n=1 Tax=Nonomuraea bangladeshensis TaxID=404385 RepID=UPI003C2FB00C
MSWIHRAACRDVDPEVFFPIASPDTKLGAAAEEEAKTVCRGCPVREECLGTSIRFGAQHGVWGGEGENARRRIASTAHGGVS